MGLDDKSDQDLNNITDHVNEVFQEVSERLDTQPEVTDAVWMLLQSESTMEDFMTLFVSQPEVTQKILMGSLSAMINAHTLVTIRKVRVTDTKSPVAQAGTGSPALNRHTAYICGSTLKVCFIIHLDFRSKC